jgi:hypothetical protein
VIKAEEWPVLMGMKRLALNWCFTPRIGGGRGNGAGCGEALGAVAPSRARPRRRKADGGGARSVQHGEEEESRVGRVGQKAEQAGGAVRSTRPEAERNSF